LFLPSLEWIDPENDRRYEKLLYRLAELYTVHNNAVTLLQRDSKTRCLAVYYHFIDWVCHDFMAYRPPRQPGINNWEVECYGEVVDAAYRVQDFLLADLWQKAGRDATVMIVSDHGFQSDHRRPQSAIRVDAGIANWHRPHGMAVFAGPQVKANVTLEGASILDIAPTLLYFMDLPVGEDMDGRAWWEVGTSGERPQFLPSWQKELQGTQFHPPSAGFHNDDEADLLQQFIDLVYIEEGSAMETDLIGATKRETAFNKGIVLLDAGRPGEALSCLWEAAAAAPELPHYAWHLARAWADLGRPKEAREAMSIIRDFGEDNSKGCFLQSQVLYAAGDLEAASMVLEKVKSEELSISERLHVGLLALHQRDLSAAASIFQEVLRLDNDSASAWMGMGRIALLTGNPGEAIKHCRRALSLNRDLAVAHLTIAQAQEKAGNADQAVIAYSNAFRLRPSLRNASHAIFREFNRAPDEIQEKVLNNIAQARTHAFPVPDKAQSRTSYKGFQSVKAAFFAARAARRKASKPVTHYIFARRQGAPSSGKTFHIVSGLPRSGTSMMMRMLAMGGWPPFTDGVREADESNPHGYYEYEPVKRLRSDPAVIEAAHGRPLKVVTPLIPGLPRQHHYKIIHMHRPVEEIVRSQRSMLALSGKPFAGTANGSTGRQMEALEHSVLQQIRDSDGIDLLVVDFHDILKNPCSFAIFTLTGINTAHHSEILIKIV